MKVHKIISKIVALVLVLLLMLSITPRLFLHEVFAGHTDTPSCNDVRPDGPCIHKQGYNCQQSDLVVPNFYLDNDSPDVTDHIRFCAATHFLYSSFLIKNISTGSQERAPPAHV